MFFAKQKIIYFIYHQLIVIIIQIIINFIFYIIISIIGGPIGVPMKLELINVAGHMDTNIEMKCQFGEISDYNYSHTFN